MTTSPALIDWQNPLTDHPLWNGLVDGWMVVPGRKGWKTASWQSLRHRYAGTLTSVSPATGWATDSPVGLWGSVDLTGTTDYIEAVGFRGFSATQTITWVTWIKTSGAAGNDFTNTFFSIGQSDTFAASVRIDGTVMVFTNGGNTGSVASTIVDDGEWHQVSCTFDQAGNSVSVSVDGRLDFTQSGYTDNSADSSPSLRIGSYGSLNFVGKISDSLCFYGAHPPDAAALYDESRRGYPNMLRRLPTAKYFVQPAAGGFQHWFARHSTTVIGASGGLSP